MGNISNNFDDNICLAAHQVDTPTYLRVTGETGAHDLAAASMKRLIETLCNDSPGFKVTVELPDQDAPSPRR